MPKQILCPLKLPLLPATCQKKQIYDFFCWRTMHCFRNLKVTPFVKEGRWKPSRTLMISTPNYPFKYVSHQERSVAINSGYDYPEKSNFPVLKGNQFNVYKFIWRSKANYPLIPLSSFKVDPWSTVSFPADRWRLKSSLSKTNPYASLPRLQPYFSSLPRFAF